MKKPEKVAKEILDDLNHYDPVCRSRIRVAAIIDKAYPEMEPVGWCVFDNEGNPKYWTMTNTENGTINEWQRNNGTIIKTWGDWLVIGYTVKQVYREVKK